MKNIEEIIEEQLIFFILKDIRYYIKLNSTTLNEAIDYYKSNISKKVFDQVVNEVDEYFAGFKMIFIEKKQIY